MKVAILLGILLLLAACTDNGSTMMQQRLQQQAVADATSDFEKTCIQNNHMWMPMLPHRNGVPVGDKACYGCMPDADNHICDMQEYLRAIGKS